MGEFVVVETDNGIDLGVVIALVDLQHLVEKRMHRSTAVDEDDTFVGRILRIASMEERQLLPAKFSDETEVVNVSFIILFLKVNFVDFLLVC